MADTLFALFHLALLLAVLVYGIVGLIQGNTIRFLLIAGGLGLYYALVLHKAVRQEIARRRDLKRGGGRGGSS